MLNRNTVLAGILFGVVLPIIGFSLLFNLFTLLEGAGVASTEGFAPNFRERTLAIIALALNLIPLQIYRRRRWEDAMRGVVIATGVLAFIWLFFYGLKLF